MLYEIMFPGNKEELCFHLIVEKKSSKPLSKLKKKCIHTKNKFL